MINNFTDAFEYVNSKHFYNVENYPGIKNLDDVESKIFEFKHELLHLLISIREINDLGMRIPSEKRNTNVWEFIHRSDEEMSDFGIEFKKAILNTIAHILSVCSTAGFSAKDCDTLRSVKLEEKDIILLIPRKQFNKHNPIVPTFLDTVNYFINQLVVILEEADRLNKIDLENIGKLSKDVFLSMNYWFDDCWLPHFLSQIPSVFKRV